LHIYLDVHAYNHNHVCLHACVLEGVMSILQHRRAHNDLGHSLCDNLRCGNWLMEYTANRLLAYPATTAVSVSQVFSPVVQPLRLIGCFHYDVICLSLTKTYVILATSCLPQGPNGEGCQHQFVVLWRHWPGVVSLSLG